MATACIGIIGLGAMGRNLARRLAEAGFAIAGCDAGAAARARFAEDGGGTVHADPAALVAALAPPRRLVLLVPAGDAVDAVLDAVAPALTPDDIVVDAGNSRWTDTAARAGRLAAAGVRFLGAGLSGGPAGARRGAAIMVGGARDAFDDMQAVFHAAAAEVDGQPCVAWFGDGGAGHLVKTVHNGIEYAEMQAVAEAYLVMRRVNGLAPPAIAEAFAAWNAGDGGSYLLGISADIVARDDPASGAPLIDALADAVSQKGTGRWCAEAALDLGVAAPTLAAAVFARNLSADRASGLRLTAAAQDDALATATTVDLRDALLATRAAAFLQGFAVIRAAAAVEGWPLHLADVAAVWRAGSILRSPLVETLRWLFAETNTFEDAARRLSDEMLGPRLPGQCRMAAAASAAGVPVPAVASALDYLHGLSAERVGADLLQAQRDLFGGHGLTGADGRPVTVDWSEPDDGG